MVWGAWSHDLRSMVTWSGEHGHMIWGASSYLFPCMQPWLSVCVYCFVLATTLSMKQNPVLCTFSLWKHWWCNGQHCCLPSSRSGFDSRPMHIFFFPLLFPIMQHCFVSQPKLDFFPFLSGILTFSKPNRTPSGKKTVTGVQRLTASQVQNIGCRWPAILS